MQGIMNTFDFQAMMAEVDNFMNMPVIAGALVVIVGVGVGSFVLERIIKAFNR